MRQHKIWVDVSSDAYSPNTQKSFGVRSHGTMDVKVGTSSTYSYDFCTVEVQTDYEEIDGNTVRIDSLFVDGVLLKKARFVDGERNEPVVIDYISMMEER
jgi:hypothetical protein